MKKTEQAARVKAINAYLEGIGHPVSSVQGYEILARALGLKNKHVLASLIDAVANDKTTSLPSFVTIANLSIPVWPADAKPLSYAEMVAKAWHFDVIIAVPVTLSDSMESIDALNDYASQTITGNESALEGLVFEHMPDIRYGQGLIAYRVTASVSQPELVFDEAADVLEADFYNNLMELAEAIVPGALVTMRSAADASNEEFGVISRVVGLGRTKDSSPDALLRNYAKSHGANNMDLNRSGNDIHFVIADANMPEVLLKSIRLGDLKYATKVAPRTWFLSIEPSGPGIHLQFK